MDLKTHSIFCRKNQSLMNLWVKSFQNFYYFSKFWNTFIIPTKLRSFNENQNEIGTFYKYFDQNHKAPRRPDSSTKKCLYSVSVKDLCEEYQLRMDLCYALTSYWDHPNLGSDLSKLRWYVSEIVYWEFWPRIEFYWALISFLNYPDWDSTHLKYQWYK